MQNKIKFYLLLTRPINLAIIACTQIIFMVHSSEFSISNIRFSQAILVILATAFTAAAGNVINDIFDIEEDQINNPEKRIIASKISPRNGRIFYAILACISLVFGFLSGYTMGFLCLGIGIMLYFYSSDLKGETLWGNLLISFMTGAVVFTSDLGVFTRFDGYFAEYALLAFFITMAREIAKDVEDIEGDKAQDYRTFPIVYGVRKSGVLAALFLLAMVLLCLYIMYLNTNLGYRIFTISLVILPALYIAFLFQKAEEKKEFHRISTLLKLLMVSGIMSVLVL